MGTRHTKTTERAKREAVARLRRFRERHPHLKDADVANAVGVAPCTVNKWMNGVNAPNGPIRANLASYIDSVDKGATRGQEPAPAGTPTHRGPTDVEEAPSKRVALVLRLAMALDDEDRLALTEALLVTL